MKLRNLLSAEIPIHPTNILLWFYMVVWNPGCNYEGGRLHILL